MTNHLIEILLALSRGGVKYLVCGGVALVLHGVERMTMDIDLSVSLDEDNLKRLLQIMKELRLVPRVPVPAESLLDPVKRKLMIEEKGALVFTFLDTENPFRQIDIFLGNQALYKDLIPNAVIVEIQGEAVPVACPADLIKMKQAVAPPRSKDRWDIEELTRIENERKKG